VHDYTTTMIKLLQTDPHDPKRRAPVLLSLAHIVRMVPQYYVESGGKRMVTALEGQGDDAQASARGLKRYFLILDVLGGTFESHTASDKGQRILEQMWNEAS
jgi:hypothetical protein